MTQTNRRNLLKSIPAAAMALALPVEAADTDPDAIIIEAWNRRVEAFGIYNALPFADESEETAGMDLTPAEKVQWTIIDANEETIRAATAKTARGATIQLWLVLSHSTSDRADEAATLRRDTRYFVCKDAELDWTDRLTLAALRSLEAMSA